MPAPNQSRVIGSTSGGGGSSGASAVDAVTDGEAAPPTSNAVFDALALKAPLTSLAWQVISAPAPLAAPATNIDFSSISSVYKALRLTMVGGASTDATDTDRLLRVRFNLDAGANYAWMRGGPGSTGADVATFAAGADDAGATYIEPASVATQQTNTTRRSQFEFVIDNHASVAWKTLVGRFYARKSSSAVQLSGQGFGTWESTARINAIRLYCSVGDWATGTTVVLEGLA